MAELVSFSFSCRDFEAENLIVFVGIILDLMGKFRAYSELCIFSLSYVTFIQKKCYESFVFYLFLWTVTSSSRKGKCHKGLFISQNLIDQVRFNLFSLDHPLYPVQLSGHSAEDTRRFQKTLGCNFRFCWIFEVYVDFHIDP